MIKPTAEDIRSLDRSLSTGVGNQLLHELRQTAERYHAYLDTIDSDRRFGIETSACVMASIQFLIEQIYYAASHTTDGDNASLTQLAEQCLTLKRDLVQNLRLTVNQGGGKAWEVLLKNQN